MPFSVNTTGPGDYDETWMLGNKTIDARKPNFPAFSIGKAEKFKLLCFDRIQGRSLHSTVSPPSTRYNPDPLKTR